MVRVFSRSETARVESSEKNYPQEGAPGSAVRSGGGTTSTAQRRRIFTVSWITYAGYYFCRKNLSIALPLLEGAKGLSHLDLANIVFGYSLFYAIGQFTCGLLSDRYGPRRIVGAGLLVICASNLMMCLHSSPLWLLSLACLNGLGQSTGWSGLVKMMGNWFSGNQRGIVMAWWSTNYVLGGFLATAFATWAVTQSMIAPHLGWRRGFLFPALLVLPVAAVFFALAKDSPETGEAGASLAAHAGGEAAKHAWNFADLLRLLSSKPLWAIGSSYFFLELCRYALMFWLPFFLVNRLRFDLTRSGYVSSLYELAGVGGALLAGYISDRYMQSRRAPVSAIMMAGFGVIVLLPMLAPRSGLVPTAIGISLAGVLTYGPDTLLSGAASQDIGGGISTATSTGFIDGIGHLGSLLSPYLVIYVSEHYGWNRVFVLFSWAAVLAAVLLVPIWKLQPADSENV
jgi:sugar phosphate permease